jgi:hypothetical protein
VKENTEPELADAIFFNPIFSLFPEQASVMIFALGGIVEASETRMSDTEFYSGLLDYYDRWSDVDSRLADHHEYLSRAAHIFGHDIVNMASYAHEIVGWLQPERTWKPWSVVSVAGMAEAFLVSVRSACDAVALALGYSASKKRGQAPTEGLRALVAWAKKNESRVQPAIMNVLSGDLEWFWKLRSLRDHIVHNGADAVIHSDGHNFDLWVYVHQIGYVTSEPLIPLLSRKLQNLIYFADSAAEAINQVIDLPEDRIRSRVVSGMLIPALHKLIQIASQYREVSPETVGETGETIDPEPTN